VRWALLVLALGGCATAPMVESTGYDAAVRARLEGASDATVHQLRYNPTGCRCPAFEIALDERWHRVELAVSGEDDPALAALLTTTREADDQLGRTYEVDGRLDDEMTRCGGGVAVLTLELNGFRQVVLSPRPESAP